MKYLLIFIPIGIIFSFLFVVLESNKSPILEIVNNRSRLMEEDTKTFTTILLGGDVMLGRSVTVQSLDVNHNAQYPFINISSVFNQSDLVFVNLENPVTENCPRKTDGMVFCAPPEMLEGLPGDKTIVTLANNHSGNYGELGLKQTKEFLSDRSILVTGQSELVTKSLHGTNFGFLGFDKDQQSNPVLSEDEKTLIQESKKKVDVLIIAMHWGIEYQAHPTEGQKRLAAELVSLGADVVEGHHPHWTQDIEMIGRAPVYYSLGNLIFDQAWSEETKKGLLVKLTFKGKSIEKQELIPTYIKSIGQPIIMPSPNE